MNATLPTTLSDHALQWAQRLVRLRTVSADSNLPLIECIADHLRTLDIPIRLTYDEERRKANLFATIGTGKPGACTAAAAPT
jgi:acetylornithine deacetylase